MGDDDTRPGVPADPGGAGGPAGAAGHRTRWIPWRGSGREGQVSATGFEQLHLVFAASKQHELDERRTALMLRDDQGDGAPPRTRVDLDGGLAVVRLPAADR